MLTKGAIGNLINRYKAVLKKCNLINTFGSLAVASMLVMGGAGAAGATDRYMEAYEGKASVQTQVVAPNSWDESGAAGGWVNEVSPADVTSVSTSFKDVSGDLIVGGNFAKNDKVSADYKFLSTDNTIEGGTVEEIRNKLSAFATNKYIVCKY